MCRGPLSGAALTPPVDLALAAAVTASCLRQPADAAQRRQQADALQQAQRSRQERLAIRASMLLVAPRLAPDYMQLLEEELALNDPLQRCRCAERFVCVRRKSGNGRAYWACPLFSVSQQESCRYFKYVV